MFGIQANKTPPALRRTPLREGNLKAHQRSTVKLNFKKPRFNSPLSEGWQACLTGCFIGLEKHLN